MMNQLEGVGDQFNHTPWRNYEATTDVFYLCSSAAACLPAMARWMRKSSTLASTAVRVSWWATR
jgi:hypothetical protein